MRSAALILALTNVAFGDQCYEQVQLLDAKLSKVLEILESHFITDYHGGSKSSYAPAYSRGGVAPAGSNYLGNTYGGAIGLSGTSTVEGYELLKAGGDHRKADSHIAVSSDKQETGYHDEIGYAGADKLGNAKAAKQAFEKGEGYLAAVNDGAEYNGDYSGTRINNSVAATRRNIVKEQQETQESYYKDFDTENHEGDYKGNEFDIGYKAKDMKGGFSQKEKEQELNQAHYNDVNAEGKKFASGKYYGEDKQLYDEAEDEEKYREFGVGAPNNGYYNEPSMYDKFQGNEKGYGGDNGDIYYDGSGLSGYATQRAQSSKEKDTHINGYGAEFDGTDAYGNSHKNEGNSGYKKDYNEADAFSVGNYQDVEAKGHNKAASYKGNYKTNKEKKDSGYKFRNDIDIDEIGTPSRYNSLVVNDNTYTFSGSEHKQADNADYKKGQYKDAEINKKYIAADQAKDYQGKDYNKQKSTDTSVRTYSGNENEKHENAQGLKKEFNSGKNDYRPVRNAAYDQGLYSNAGYGGYGYSGYRRRRY